MVMTRGGDTRIGGPNQNVLPGWESNHEKEDTWNRSLKESQKREEELTVLVDAIEDKPEKRSEHTGEVFNTYESWVRKSEKSELSEAVAHRARTAVREARRFSSEIWWKMIEKDDSFEADANLAAGRLWQDSQSDETKRNLLRDLEDFVTAFAQNGWDKHREASVKMWGMR